MEILRRRLTKLEPEDQVVAWECDLSRDDVIEIVIVQLGEDRVIRLTRPEARELRSQLRRALLAE
ncbi:hypothetical protein [Sandaracinus amylolyticus]|uniref:Uncharacterized protein n=1 Tax=Sandaracinus amylolyticus TaxID=927083 RepID=A0A0F6W367_9BACT|nr:hypothetical protein [Sandaracinus amylolyticus]AKF06102.1 hypothetical protein DB32_003251 [Sandaracinus amylolyticus]